MTVIYVCMISDTQTPCPLTDLDGSPSHLANHEPDKIKKFVHPSPVFSHWFALELYSLFKDNKLKLLNTDFPVNEDALETLLESLMNVVEYTNQANGYRMGNQSGSELASTAIIARMFDRFLFPDCKLGACLHQMPTRKREQGTERSDMYCLTLKNYIPERPLLVSAWKKYNEEIEKAGYETDAYAITALRECYPEDTTAYPLLLGLSGTKDQYILKLYCSCGKHMHSIEVAKAMTNEPHELKQLLIVTHYAINYLTQHSLYSINCCTVQVKCCNSEHKSLKKDLWSDYKALWRSESYKQLLAIGNVIHCVGRNVVVKYYDKENNNELDSNTELMKKLI